MKKYKIKLIIIFIIFILVYMINLNSKILLLQKNNIELKAYIEPINLDDGLINNEYWSIYSDGTNSELTQKGINNVIEYANRNGIEYLKLKQGIYLVDSNSFEKIERSIILKSNITLDLNGSIIKIKSNSKTNYGILSIIDVENVSISNGIVIGDRYEHTYSGSTTHEWGMGIDIRGSKNINIFNIQIYNTTGDGIYIAEFGKKISESIKINNCNIYDTRRQGISIITANNVNIFNNEIHDINGTPPQAGIDLEKNDVNQEIKNIYILNNKFYGCKSNVGIWLSLNIENVYIDKNELYGNININNNTDNKTIHLENNTFKVSKSNDYSNLTTDITDTFNDENLKKAVLDLVGKEETDRILESDIAKIASDNVPGGKQLNLANKGITNLAGIENFAKYNIEWIYLDNNAITDLTPLASFMSLTKLNASNNNISDISVLAGLTNLKTINLTNNKVEDITAFTKLNVLEYVYLNNNKIQSLDSLTNKNELKEIYCFENQIESIENLVSLPKIEKLDVGKNSIKTVLTKPNSTTLKYLNLDKNNLIDISGLGENNIEKLNIKNQYINVGTGQVISNGYLQINLPQIFSTIDDTYSITVNNLSEYQLKEQNKSIMILASEFKQYGLNIIISKDGNTYITYSMNIDNSISDEVNSKFNVMEFTNEFVLTGINAKANKAGDFVENANFETNYSVSFYNNDVMLSCNDIITTGTRMRVYNSEKDFYQDYTIVVYGDVDGDGDINSLDALNIVGNKLHSDEQNIDINSIYVEAGRTTEDSRKAKTIPNSIDALAIVKDKLNLYKIKQL